MTSFVIVGTDTNVGKTVLSAVLLSSDPSLHYWKPIQSGLHEETDTQTIARISECATDRILPEAYALTQPLSPHISASIDSVTIDLKQLQAPTDRNIIIETAGGVLVPLNSTDLQIAAIKQWNMPVLIATRSALGTINHSLLTIQALRQREIEIAGFVMIGERNIDNEQAIEEYGKIKRLGCIPFLPMIDRKILVEVFNQYFARFREYVKQ